MVTTDYMCIELIRPTFPAIQHGRTNQGPSKSRFSLSVSMLTSSARNVVMRSGVQVKITVCPLVGVHQKTCSDAKVEATVNGPRLDASGRPGNIDPMKRIVLGKRSPRDLDVMRLRRTRSNKATAWPAESIGF